MDNTENIIVQVTEEGLAELWDGFAEEDDLPLWEELSDKQVWAALRVVQALHESIDEYHSMIDAIEETK